VNILAVHTGGVGDFVLACPAVAWLARQGTVTLAGSPERLAVAVEAGLAHRACPLDAIDFHSAFARPTPRLRDFVRGFDRVLVWMRDADGSLRRTLEGAGARFVRCVPGLPPPDWPAHATAYYLDSVGAPSAEAVPSLPVAPEPGPWDVLIHPGSGSPKKNWPVEHFATLAVRFQQAGLRVGWLAGPAEDALALPAWADRVPPRPLAELARLLAGTRRYVGNDSGVSHLAAAVGCPTVAVFGPTDPAVWAPRGAEVRVLRGDPWPGVDAVWSACGVPPHRA
jgi:hypothetical protein